MPLATGCARRNFARLPPPAPTDMISLRRTTSACWAVALLSISGRSAVAQQVVPLGPTVKTTQPADRTPVPPPAPAGTALTASDVNAWLDGYMPHALKTGDIAGAVVAVVKDGQILTTRGYGYSDVAKRTPVDPKLTLFRPGSVSKLVTWTAVMQQVELGKIQLDADVNQYLDFRIPPRDGKPVTMRQLMQHTAGFEEQAKDIMSGDRKATPTFDVLLKRWTPTRIFAPGTTPAYSNYGASLAGYIVQRVSGEPFDSYVERHIFQPLGMTHSTFRQPLPSTLAPLMSKGYSVASKDPKPFEIVGPSPAGSLSSSGEDMARFMIAHLQSGSYQGNRILQPATAAMMHDSPLTVLPALNRMELGFFETNINGREVIAHLGDTENFHTSLHLFLKDGVGFYVSFNSPGKGGAAGGLRGALFEDFADRYLPNTEKDGRVDDSTSAKHAAMMAGSWVNSRRAESNFISSVGLVSQVKLGVSKGELVAPLPGLNGEPRKWVEIAPFVWREANGHQRLAANVVDGTVVRWSFDGISPFMVFDRAPWYENSAWLLPLLIGSLAALALTAVTWPVAAIVRRRYGATLALDTRARRAFRLSRIAAIALLVTTLGWALAVGLLLSDINRLSSTTDPLIRTLQVVGTLIFVGGAALLLWNLWVVWTGHRRWPARVWSVVMALSSLVVVWVALVFKLISFGVNY
jgi:CubicO group peptidase (beta-lactamase class C family)